MQLIEKMEKFNIKNVENLSGKKVLLRIDVNVSLGNNGVVDKG
jgi:3-phosphoglycerate kinase